MIEKTGADNWIVSCDSCSNQEEIDARKFIEVVDEIKELGWRIVRKNDEWNHRVCPVCLDENTEKLKAQMADANREMFGDDAEYFDNAGIYDMGDK